MEDRIIPDEPLFVNSPVLHFIFESAVDDGIDETHEDLDDNYRADLSKDFVGGAKDDDHGTPVAGIVAAEGNNGAGVSGVAPEASIADLRKLGKRQTDSESASILSHKNQEIDIYQNSWSPGKNKNPINLLSPGLATLNQMELGVKEGRNGLGNIYVFSAGNNRERDWDKDGNITKFGDDNVNNNGYANSRFTISVGAIGDNGVHSSYSEPGAALFVAAHSSGDSRPGTLTTDVSGSAGSNGLEQLVEAEKDYTFFSGTSSAAPLVSGVIALMLEANPNLTWRDVQHILAKTARKNDSSHLDWSVNGAGYNVNHFYGFGAVDATAAVNAAKTWQTVADEVSHTTGEMPVNATIPDNSSSGISRTINVQQDIQLESVEVVFDADHYSRGDLEIVLTSPDGTESILAEQRPDEGDNYTYWVFNTVRNWGESSKGNWTLRVADKSGGQVGTWDSWKLNFYGTEAKPAISTVSVTTPDGEAAETNLGELSNPAEFVVSRSGGDNSKAEKVYYSVTGTATSGEDYTELAGFVTIPAGQDSAPVTINPLNDTKYEELENVVFRIEEHESYKLGGVIQGVATIASNDAKPVSKISVTTLDNEAAETNPGETPNTAAFVISRSGGDNTKAETIRYSIVLRDKNGNVYNTIAETKVIPAGSTQAVVTFTPTNDTTYDGTESIHFEVTSDPNYQLGGQTTGSATLLDNDEPPKSILNVSAVDNFAHEAGSTPAKFRITRNGGDNSRAETVYYNLTGTATEGTDYQFLSGVTQIPAGQTETFVTVTPIDDSMHEGTENVTFTVQSSNNYVLGSSVQDSITIVDDDPKPVSTITVEVDDDEAREAAPGEEKNPAKFIVRRSGGDNSQPETVRYAINLKDKDGNIYRTQTGVTTISAGYSGVRLSYTPFDDSTYDGTESIEFVVTSDSSYKLGTVISGTATLLDNELPPKSTLNVTVTDATASETVWYESPDPAEFEISRSGGDNNKAETVYYTVSGTASNGADYVYLSGAVTIPAGETTTKVSIQPQDDSVYEGLESINFSISGDPSYELGSTVSGTATIADNDEKPVSTITVEVDDNTATETAEGETTDPAAFIIRRSGGDNSQPETVRYTINLKDKDGNIYRTQTGVTTISEGFSGVRLRYTPFDDSTYDGTESIEFSVTSDPSYKLGGTTSGTATLLDNELPPKSTLNVTVADDTAAETAWYKSPNPAVFEITRSGGDNSQAETVYYTVSGTATNGDDYTYLSGAVTIPAGETSAKVAVQPQDDSIYEGTEGITFSVSSDPSYKLGATTNGTASIEDNDFPPSVITVTTEESVANESGNPAKFRINRSGGDNSKDETVYYSLTGTADNGEDYTYLSGVATILAGMTSTVVTLNPLDDSTYEGTETVTFQVTNNTNYNLGTTTRGEAAIEDNDPAPPAISIGGKSHAFGVSWSGELTHIDLETGVSESLGSTGFSNLNSLTSDGQGKLLTIANVNSSVGEIIQIDPSDGTSRVVSTFNNNFGGVKASIRGLTRAADGSLYAIHNTSGNGFIGGDTLFRIDPQTGTASEIAILDRSSLQSLAMAPSGKLYSVDMSDGALIEIDPNTGSSKTIGAKGGFLNIQGLAFDDNGVLYATGQPNSYTVDLQTGALTVVPELGTFRGLAFVSESQPASSPGTSNATTLYDITFDESSQALGQQPLANDSSNTVSEVVFGDPTVKQSSGRLGNRPLVFTDDQSGYDQVKLDVGAGFERYSLSFDFDPVWLNGEEMTVLLDTPRVQNIHFQPDGSVRLYPFGTVGTFDLNGVNQVETEVDFEADRWKLIVNGNVLYDGEFSPSSDDLRAIRFSMGALREVSGSVAAIDNIQLKGLSSSSATTPPPLAGSPNPGNAPPASTNPGLGNLTP